MDIGSGSGDFGHPSAITFIAVRPDYRKGRVFRHWNGKGQLTTAADTLDVFMQMRGNLTFVAKAFDYSAKDFGTIAARAGESFLKADKGRDSGDATINSLFKHKILDIDEIPECDQLIYEMESASYKESKQKAVDDSCDSARYCIMLIPWDWTFIEKQAAILPLAIPTESEIRRDFFTHTNEIFDDEISEWQEHYEV